jgi:hypothetical protein
MLLSSVIPSKDQVKDEGWTLVGVIGMPGFFNFFLGDHGSCHVDPSQDVPGCLCVVKWSLGAIRGKKSVRLANVQISGRRPLLPLNPYPRP